MDGSSATSHVHIQLFPCEPITQCLEIASKNCLEEWLLHSTCLVGTDVSIVVIVNFLLAWTSSNVLFIELYHTPYWFDKQVQGLKDKIAACHVMNNKRRDKC